MQSLWGNHIKIPFSLSAMTVCQPTDTLLLITDMKIQKPVASETMSRRIIPRKALPASGCKILTASLAKSTPDLDFDFPFTSYRRGLGAATCLPSMLTTSLKSNSSRNGLARKATTLQPIKSRHGEEHTCQT